MFDLLFSILHDSENTFFELFTGQSLAMTIMIFVYMVKHIRKVFIYFSGHIHSFILHIRIFSPLFKYVRNVKIVRHIICNLILCLLFFIRVHSDLSSSVELSFYTSAEELCNKELMTMICFDSSLFAKQLCNKVSCTLIRFDSS